jgi:hypothetical protein
MGKDNSSEQTRLLSEILKWVRFAGMKEVKNTLITVLDTDVKKSVYQKSDGTRGSVELAKMVGIGSNKTIDNMWDIWLNMGLGESIPVRGGKRFKRSFNLENFGIKVPELKAEIVQGETKEKPVEQKTEASK